MQLLFTAWVASNGMTILVSINFKFGNRIMLTEQINDMIYK
jgi:hypothetical protein